jgi:hypothetical protein
LVPGLSADYGNGKFVLLCEDNSVLTSADGTNWTKTFAFSQLGDVCQSVAFGNGTFVAVGGRTNVYSNDGVNWNPARSGIQGQAEFNQVRFLGDTFVAVNRLGGIWSSTNGMDWVYHYSGTERNLSDVAYGNGSYVVVGDSGVILQNSAAAPPSAWSLWLAPVAALPDGTCALTLEGAAGHTWELDASSDLVNWSSLTNLLSTNSILQYIDQDATKYPARFYRARGW